MYLRESRLQRPNNVTTNQWTWLLFAFHLKSKYAEDVI